MKKVIPADQVALPADLKRANRQKILQVLRTGCTVTAADIHEQTGISRPTVMRALQHYCDLGVIRSLGLGQTTSMGGKKPELFAFADERRILCINLWPESITLALCGLIGDIYAVEQIAHEMGGDVEEAMLSLEKALKEYLQAQNLRPAQLYGVVLTVPGTVDYDTRLLRYNVKAPGWGANVDLTQHLRRMLGDTPLYFIDNAGKAAGRAVLFDHPEYQQKRLMTFFTTWGVSACMMDKGHVLNGRDSLIGEIGHMIIAKDGPVLCGCGKRGCLESMVSLWQVQRMMEDETVTFPTLFARSAAGDAEAQNMVRYLAGCFAVALHNLSLCYNQEIVVFQGDFALADSVFDQTLRQELCAFRYYPDGDPFTIVYDRRDLALLAALGGAEPLRKRYFSDLA